MKRLGLIALVCSILPVAALATEPGDMIGVWQFAPALSRNVGSMAQARVTSSVSLRGERLTVEDVSLYLGKEYRQQTVYDLSGTPVAEVSQMGSTCKTVAHWTKDHLKVDWVCPGAVAGATVHRREYRYLIHSREVMIVESQRAGAPIMIMAFMRK